MQTSKDFSTITYNSIDFLQSKLNELTKAHIISKWYFICHKAEADEKKDHIHLFITPNKRVNTDLLFEEFTEFDPKHPTKPLKCMTARSSKFTDWYLYSIHDVSYLAQKGLTRDHHYTESDFICSDEDEFFRDVRSINLLELSPIYRVFSSVMQGETFSEFLMRGCVPIQQISSYEKAWAYCTEYKQRTENL